VQVFTLRGLAQSPVSGTPGLLIGYDCAGVLSVARRTGSLA
jgi:hypothetical protein